MERDAQLQNQHRCSVYEPVVSVPDGAYKIDWASIEKQKKVDMGNFLTAFENQEKPT